jgi:hypothetical protein
VIVMRILARFANGIAQALRARTLIIAAVG